MNDHEENQVYISHDLEHLADAEEQYDLLCSEKETLYDDLLTDEIRQQMVEIDAEFNDRIETIGEMVVQLRKSIKEDVLDYGETVKGEHLQAVWNKGRTSWDTKALKGYAVTHPDVNQLRKQGDPTVTIRKVK